MDQLKAHYVNPSLPGSFSGFESFFRALKEKGIKTTRKVVQNWLASQRAYSLHKSIRHKFPRNKVIVCGIDDTWQADLIDLKGLTRANDGHRYILTCIDVFSKYAWVIPLKHKTAIESSNAFLKIFNDSKRKPKNLQCDKGTEFFNKKIKDLFNSKDIKLYAIHSDKKACVVERFNRTLKEKMWRYFTEKKTHKFIDIIDNLINSYNNTYHRTIGMKPIEVNKDNEKILWKKMYSYRNVDIKFKFKVNDKVRITKYKNTFEKGYTPNWTEEIFIITKQLARIPPVYKIKDLNNNEINGVFYENELQIVYNPDETFLIEKVLRKRKNKETKKFEYFVKWVGYPREFNSWIQEEDYVK